MSKNRNDRSIPPIRGLDGNFYKLPEEMNGYMAAYRNNINEAKLLNASKTTGQLVNIKIRRLKSLKEKKEEFEAAVAEVQKNRYLKKGIAISYEDGLDDYIKIMPKKEYFMHYFIKNLEDYATYTIEITETNKAERIISKSFIINDKKLISANGPLFPSDNNLKISNNSEILMLDGVSREQFVAIFNSAVDETGCEMAIFRAGPNNEYRMLIEVAKEKDFCSLTWLDEDNQIRQLFENKMIKEALKCASSEVLINDLPFVAIRNQINYLDEFEIAILSPIKGRKKFTVYQEDYSINHIFDVFQSYNEFMLALDRYNAATENEMGNIWRKKHNSISFAVSSIVKRSNSYMSSVPYLFTYKELFKEEADNMTIKHDKILNLDDNKIGERYKIDSSYFDSVLFFDFHSNDTSLSLASSLPEISFKSQNYLAKKSTFYLKFIPHNIEIFANKSAYYIAQDLFAPFSKNESCTINNHPIDIISGKTIEDVAIKINSASDKYHVRIGFDNHTDESNQTSFRVLMDYGIEQSLKRPISPRIKCKQLQKFFIQKQFNITNIYEYGKNTALDFFDLSKAFKFGINDDHNKFIHWFPVTHIEQLNSNENPFAEINSIPKICLTLEPPNYAKDFCFQLYFSVLLKKIGQRYDKIKNDIAANNISSENINNNDTDISLGQHHEYTIEFSAKNGLFNLLRKETATPIYNELLIAEKYRETIEKKNIEYEKEIEKSAREHYGKINREMTKFDVEDFGDIYDILLKEL